MADHLILSSLQPPPFLIFPCYLHRRWRFSGGSRFSVPELRLSSSQLQLANSTSSSQSSSSDSAPEKFDLVSTTRLNDGSHVFRFGDASEIERYRETEAKLKKQHAKLAEEASEESDANIETGSEKEERAAPSNLSNVVIKIKDRKRVRSSSKKKKETSNSAQSEDKVNANIASVSNLSSVVTVAEAIPTSSTEEKVEAKVASVSNQSSIVSAAEAIPTSSTEEKAVVPRESEPVNENVEPLSSEVIEKVSVNEIENCEITNGYQQLTENRVEVQARPRLSTSQHGSQSYDLEEVAHVSTIELDENLDVRETPRKTFEAEENLVVEPRATATVSPDELISTSEATHHSVNKIAETPVIDTSEENLVVEPTATATACPDELISTSEATHHSVDKIAETPVIDTSEVANEGENVASTIEDEIAVNDTNADNGCISKTGSDTEGEDLQLHAPETAGLESIEVASDREEFVSKAYYLESGFASLQSPFKALAGREDAYFVSHHNWLGIADGFSQWSFEGIKKGKYAQELMRNCQKIISDETDKITDPVQVLHRSVSATKSLGSSTALIAHLDNNELHIVNIGDSGFMVIRNRAVLQKSSPMFHHFYFPLQITQGDDVRKLAEVYHVNLEEGDVIITATDGLFDNLYEKEIVTIVCRLLEQSLEPQQKAAELVAAKAQEVGRSKTERTPFADAAKEEGYDGFKGGKLDAVTIIVSLVKTVSS
ncbi:unnamed protein product [Arabis nemorensis]|uniref:Protein phosphatase n=1 Tax=Arabis nemorensis TaxID=586526 RepID=A0A565CA40_9BRAS|nr:unnamed protein product [Arabis nemorensis]